MMLPGHKFLSNQKYWPARQHTKTLHRQKPSTRASQSMDTHWHRLAHRDIIYTRAEQEAVFHKARVQGHYQTQLLNITDEA